MIDAASPAPGAAAAMPARPARDRIAANHLVADRLRQAADLLEQPAGQCPPRPRVPARRRQRREHWRGSAGGLRSRRAVRAAHHPGRWQPYRRRDRPDAGGLDTVGSTRERESTTMR